MSQKNTIIAIFIVFVVALLLSEGEPKKLAHWDYSEDKGPKEWANLDERYNMCGEGKNQSPINITDSIDAELLPLRLKGESKAKHLLIMDIQFKLTLTMEVISILVIKNTL